MGTFFNLLSFFHCVWGCLPAGCLLTSLVFVLCGCPINPPWILHSHTSCPGYRSVLMVLGLCTPKLVYDVFSPHWPWHSQPGFLHLTAPLHPLCPAYMDTLLISLVLQWPTRTLLYVDTLITLLGFWDPKLSHPQTWVPSSSRGSSPRWLFPCRHPPQLFWVWNPHTKLPSQVNDHRYVPALTTLGLHSLGSWRERWSVGPFGKKMLKWIWEYKVFIVELYLRSPRTGRGLLPAHL